MTPHTAQQLENERAEMLERAVEVGDRQGGQQDRVSMYQLLERYYQHMPLEEMRGRDAVDIAGAALSHRQLAVRRPQGTANVRTFTPTVEQNAWSTGHSVIEIVTDDMPFLVDSVISELNRQECVIHLIVHPQMVVRRTVSGDLVEVLDASSTEWLEGERPGDTLVESWMHIEIDRQSDPARLEQITSALSRVLDDVRVSVEDWPLMMTRVTRHRRRAGANPPAGIDPDEVAEARRLLTWLADAHFTFLGYREYRLVEPGRPRSRWSPPRGPDSASCATTRPPAPASTGWASRPGPRLGRRPCW